MKLTRTELIRAQDVQLKILGLRRRHNSGWLKQGLSMEFTPEIVKIFHNARKKTKGEELFPNRIVKEHGPYVMSQLDPQKILSLFRSGKSIMDIASECLASPFDVESTLRIALNNPESPEKFANDLYEKCNRDLS